MNASLQPDPETGNAEIIRAAWGAQGFARLVGMEIGSIRPGSVEVYLDSRSELTQQNGFIHGAVVGFLADNVCAGVAGTMLRDREPGTVVLTSEYKINFIRPAVGERLVARGEVLHAGSRQSVTQGKVYAVHNGEEKLVAVAQATVAHFAPPAPGHLSAGG